MDNIRKKELATQLKDNELLKEVLASMMSGFLLTVDSAADRDDVFIASVKRNALIRLKQQLFESLPVDERNT